MTEVFCHIYNEVANESLEELRADMGSSNTAKYTVDINTDETYE